MLRPFTYRAGQDLPARHIGKNRQEGKKSALTLTGELIYVLWCKFVLKKIYPFLTHDVRRLTIVVKRCENYYLIRRRVFDVLK